MLVSIPLGRYLDDVVINQKYYHLLQSVMDFMNSARVCWIIRRTVFNMYISLNYS